jgi:hypothetical protein
MLRKLSEEVHYAQRMAADAGEKAANAADPKLKAHYLALEQSWSKLARSYELTERIGDFIHHFKGKQSEALRAQLPVVHCPGCVAPMRLALVVPHSEDDRLDERTYECTCGRRVEVVAPKS